MTIEEIRKLPSPVRCAGYLARSALAAEYGANLRTKYKNDEDWTLEEQAEWDKLVDETDPWFYALSQYEIDVIAPAELMLASLCRGEFPIYDSSPEDVY